MATSNFIDTATIWLHARNAVPKKIKLFWDSLTEKNLT